MDEKDLHEGHAIGEAPLTACTHSFWHMPSKVRISLYAAKEAARRERARAKLALIAPLAGQRSGIWGFACGVSGLGPVLLMP